MQLKNIYFETKVATLHGSAVRSDAIHRFDE